MEGIWGVLKCVVVGMVLMFVTFCLYTYADELEQQKKAVAIEESLVINTMISKVTAKYANIRSEFHHKMPELQSLANKLANAEIENGGQWLSLTCLSFFLLSTSFSMISIMCIAPAIRDL